VDVGAGRGGNKGGAQGHIKRVKSMDRRKKIKQKTRRKGSISLKAPGKRPKVILSRKKESTNFSGRLLKEHIDPSMRRRAERSE